MPKLQYPAYFEDGLCGTKVVEDIKHREAFAFCPFKMILSTKKAQTHPIVGKIIEENESVFLEDGRNEDWEQQTLAIFMFYEMTLGVKSYWFPYFK